MSQDEEVHYQRDSNMAPDAAFEAGRLDHLVIGNEGRLLDARRTPVRIVGLRPELAFFELEVLAFDSLCSPKSETGGTEFRNGNAPEGDRRCVAVKARSSGVVDAEHPPLRMDTPPQ